MALQDLQQKNMEEEKAQEKYRLSNFEVDLEEEREKTIMMRVMNALRTHLCDQYTLRGRGKNNVKGAERIAKTLTRWIAIDEIKAWRVHDECFIIVWFHRSDDFKARFIRQKEKIAEKRAKEEAEEENRLARFR